ncbi:hypothetical protein LTR66_003273 [Elasticomyces elasticus]|nr:hypothetical protein LTR66_003273 [Elasticomyces elasticus]
MVVMNKKRVKKRLGSSAKEFREHAINVARPARANPKKRGIQPGYIRTLELTLAWIFSTVPRCEDMLKADLALEGGRARSLILGKSVEAAEEFRKRWSKSAVCKQIDRLLSRADVEESPNMDWEDEYSSVQQPRVREAALQHSQWPDNGTAMQDRRHTSPGNGNTHTNSSRDPPRVSSSANPNPGAAESAMSSIPRSTISHTSRPRKTSFAHNTQRPSTLSLPTDVWRLFDVYDAFTHSWLPISEKHDVLKTAYSYSSEGLSITADSPDSADHAELWSIVALASYQVATDPGDLEPNRLTTIARSLIPSEQGTLRVGHAKALLLLTLIAIGRQRWSTAWFMVGYAVRVCLDLGLLDLAGQPGVSNIAHQARTRHALLGCFVLDTLISIHLDRPPHLRPEQITKACFLDEDGIDEWHPWSACEGFPCGVPATDRALRTPSRALSTFNELVQTCKIWARAKFEPKSLGSEPVSSEVQQWLDRHTIPVLSQNLRMMRTPQLVHLQFAVCCAHEELRSLNESNSSRISEHVAPLLDHFTRTFGIAAMPPTMTIHCKHPGRKGLIENTALRQCTSDVVGTIRTRWLIGQGDTAENAPDHGELLSVASQDPARPSLKIADDHPPGVDAEQRHRQVQRQWSQSPRINNADGNFLTQRDTSNMPSKHVAPTQPVSQYSNNLTTTHFMSPPQALMLPGSPVFKTGNAIGSMLNAEEYDYSQPSLNTLHNLSGDPQATDQDLAQMNQSVDLDAIFEDLAALDGANRYDNQPQFMQNLGFAPDLDLSAFFGADYQQFDPLLTFMQSNAPGANSTNNNYPGG